MKSKIIRITTVPESLSSLLKGQLQFMSQYYEVIGISSGGGDRLEKVGIREGINVIPLEMTRKITPVQDLRAAWKLYRIFKKEKPFIVHTHTPKAGTLGMLAAFLAGVPHRLHTIAGLPLLEVRGRKRILLDIVEKLTYACATKIYPNSFGLKEIILKNNYTFETKLKVIGEGSSNGINTSFFDPNQYNVESRSSLRKSLGIQENDFVYIFVGRLVKDKGINELVQAFISVTSQYKNTKLLLVGHFENDLDPLETETTNLIANYNQIITVGWQPDVRPYFSISNCLTFPSYREGFPNVVMQAGAMGLNSIVTDINGCNEIIENGKNGVLIPPKNKDALEKAMLFSYHQGPGSKNKAEINREMIVSRYNQAMVWQAILQEYRCLEK